MPKTPAPQINMSATTKADVLAADGEVPHRLALELIGQALRHRLER